MTAGAFSEHLDDCEALMSLVEECLTGRLQCYYYCNGTVGGQGLLSLTLVFSLHRLRALLLNAHYFYPPFGTF